MDNARASELGQTVPGMAGDVTHLRQVTRQQWRSGIAAWLGWTFDGLDMHLYTLVAAPFVAQLIGAASTTDPKVGHYGSLIQGAFLLGWALGGRFLRAYWRPPGPGARAEPHHPDLRRVHRAVFLCNVLVAPGHLPVPGRAGHWRRMGGGGLIALGNLAAPVAALDRSGAPDRRERRHPRRGLG